VSDDPVAAIVAHLTEHATALAVMATHASTGVEREAFGSVAMGVIAASPCPVRVVRPTRVHRPILG
jgi:nucleotide-binding universal stress UspA family protein